MRKKVGWCLFALVFASCIGLIWHDTEADAYNDNDPTPIVVDEYDFSLKLQVPQVLDNSTSLGYRKFQPQQIDGKMYIVWMDNGSFKVEFNNLINRDFKVRGVNVTYQGLQDAAIYPRYNYIGNNNTGRFNTPCLCFSAMFEPSYAKGGATEDNSFVLTFAAKGYATHKKKLGFTVATRFSGHAVGHQGCGCMDYGHKSPTRQAVPAGPGVVVSDVVATYGTWTARWKGREYLQ